MFGFQGWEPWGSYRSGLESEAQPTRRSHLEPVKKDPHLDQTSYSVVAVAKGIGERLTHDCGRYLRAHRGLEAAT